MSGSNAPSVVAATHNVYWSGERSNAGCNLYAIEIPSVNPASA